MYNPDPYDTSHPKYTTATEILEGLQALAQGEEIEILLEIFPDVSCEGQGYYYQDRGVDLLQRYEEVSEYGSKLWLMELAVWQTDCNEDSAFYDLHDFIPMILSDSDLAKRIGFKKIFVDTMLRGDARQYEAVREAYTAELRELDCNTYYYNQKAFRDVMEARGAPIVISSPYGNLCHALHKRLKGLQLPEETRLVVECRALLNSYDDFILGLRMNQHLHEYQEQQYNRITFELKAAYEQTLAGLLAAAEKCGLLQELEIELKMLGGGHP